MTTRAEIVSTARGYLGTRYQHEGRNAHGLDCCGLILVVAWDLGISTYDIRGYPRQPKPGYVRHFIEAGCIPIPLAEAVSGDIGIFRSDAFPFHSGILAERDGMRTLIHAYLPRRKVVEEPFQHLIVDMWCHALRYPGLEG